MRLIDADALMDAMRDEEFQTFVPLDEIDSVIDKAPTIDAEPVKHGQWKYEMFRGKKTLTADGLISCGNCHTHFFRVIGVRFRHCPDCGAKMYLVEGGGNATD